MRRFAIAVVVLVAHLAPAAQVPQTPPGPDAVSRLLTDLQNALRGNADDIRALAAPNIAPSIIGYMSELTRASAASSVIVRERTRRPAATGFDVAADVLFEQGAKGRVATWLIAARPDRDAAGPFKITDLREISAVDGLLKLTLDTSRQFDIKNLTLTATDLTLTVGSGFAFAAMAPSGVTGLVVRGKGSLRFAPPDPAEQLQLKIFSHRSDFITDVDTVFVRMSPVEMAQRVSLDSLVPVDVRPDDLARAQQLFDEYAPKTYSLDLRALTSDRWSLEPLFGSMVVEFRTKTHGWLTYTRSPAEAEDIALFDRVGSRNICQYSSSARIASRGRSYGDEDVALYDVEHYAVDLAFDPARSRINGRGSLRLRITSDATSTITIKLASQLVVTRAASPEFGELLALRVIGQNSLLVGLPAAVHRGSLLTIDLSYTGILPPQTIDQESLNVDPQDKPQDKPQDEPIVTPEPRFMYSNRVQWYPQGVASDYATAEMRITAPAEYQIVASGRLVGSSVAPPAAGSATSAGTRTVQYVADRPVRYLAVLMGRLGPVGNLSVTVPALAPTAGASTESATTVALDVVSTPRMVSRNRQTAARAGEILRFYAEQMGGAPYPTLTVAGLDDNLPGGHSPAYLVALHQPLPTTPYSWADDPVAFDTVFPSFFLAHEVAHQWWGQAIGWRNYHDQWLSEGTAQYFAVLFAAHDRGPDLLETIITTMRDRSQPLLNQGPISLGYRVGHIQRDSRALRSIIYNKSAVVLHMLRRYIGDEAFFSGLRLFYSDWRFRKAGTDDFEAAMQATTTQPLEKFFDQWIRGFTLPRVRLSWRTEDDGATGVIRVEQLREPFDFPLTVNVQFADGSSVDRTLKVTGAAYEERLALKSALRRVSAKDELSYYELAR